MFTAVPIPCLHVRDIAAMEVTILWSFPLISVKAETNF